MKFTQSVDGVLRCDLRVTVRVGRDDIINALAASTRDDMLEDLPRKISASAMWKRVREIIAEFGEATSFWAEDRDDVDDVLAWAAANVDRILKAKQ